MDEKWAFATRRTSDLFEVLAQVNDDYDDLGSWLREYLKVFDIRRADVVHKSCLDSTFAYQIIAGMRNGSRDKLIQLSRGMELDIERTDELLERGGVSALRTFVDRDVVIAFCIARNMTVPECDEMLMRAGMPPLRPDYAKTHQDL